MRSKPAPSIWSQRTCTTIDVSPTIDLDAGRKGSIDWPATLMSLQKIGYDGTWLFEVANTSTAKAVLEKASAGIGAVAENCSASTSRTPPVFRRITPDK